MATEADLMDVIRAQARALELLAGERAAVAAAQQEQAALKRKRAAARAQQRRLRQAGCEYRKGEGWVLPNGSAVASAEAAEQALVAILSSPVAGLSRDIEATAQRLAGDEKEGVPLEKKVSPHPFKEKTPFPQKDLPASSASEPAQPAAQLSLVDSQPPQPESPPTPPPLPAKKRGYVPNAVSEWYEWAQAERKRQLGEDTPASPLRKDQWSRLGEAVKLHGQELLKVAHRLFLGDEYARGQGFPTGLFVSRWEDWVGRAKAAGPAPKPAAEPVKWRVF